MWSMCAIVVSWLLPTRKSFSKPTLALAKNTPNAQDVAMNIAEQLKEEGRVEGFASGQALALLKLLKLRFGAVSVKVERVISAAPRGCATIRSLPSARESRR